MKNYKQSWTEFEVQSLAYSILRKSLYPKYLVRGEYLFKEQDKKSSRVDIAIFKAHLDREPELVLVIEIKKGIHGVSTRQGERYSSHLGVPCIYIRGQDDAYKALKLVSEYLEV